MGCTGSKAHAQPPGKGPRPEASSTLSDGTTTASPWPSLLGTGQTGEVPARSLAAACLTDLPLSGTWVYDSKGGEHGEYRISRAEDRQPRFEAHLPGWRVSGPLKQQGQWLEAELGFAGQGYSECSSFGVVRLRPTREAMLSQFRAMGAAEWGPEIVSHKRSPCIGNWVYDADGNECRIGMSVDGQLCVNLQDTSGRVACGFLWPRGQWLQAELKFCSGEPLGAMQLRFLPEREAILTNFRPHDGTEWGPDVVAHKDSPLIGTWLYGGDAGQYRISMTAAGCLRFDSQRLTEEEVAGDLQVQEDAEGQWLEAELDDGLGKQFGTVRVRFVEEQGTALSNFRSTSSSMWGPDIVAHKLPKHKAFRFVGPTQPSSPTSLALMGLLPPSPLAAGLSAAAVEAPSPAQCWLSQWCGAFFCCTEAGHKEEIR